MTDPLVSQRMNKVRDAFVSYAKDNNKNHINKINEVDLMMAAQDTNYFFNSNEGYLKGLIKHRLEEIRSTKEIYQRNLEKIVWLLLGFLFGIVGPLIARYMNIFLSTFVQNS